MNHFITQFTNLTHLAHKMTAHFFSLPYCLHRSPRPFLSRINAINSAFFSKYTPSEIQTKNITKNTVKVNWRSLKQFSRLLLKLRSQLSESEWTLVYSFVLYLNGLHHWKFCGDEFSKNYLSNPDNSCSISCFGGNCQGQRWQSDNYCCIYLNIRPEG